METLGRVEASTPRTNLVVHHGVTDILDQAAKFVHVLGAVQEPCDFASLCKWVDILKNIVQFPSKLHTSGQFQIFGSEDLLFENCPPLSLFCITLRSRRAE